MSELVIAEQGGLILATGAILKPRDDRENPFLFAAHAPPPPPASGAKGNLIITPEKQFTAAQKKEWKGAQVTVNKRA